jgi:hypothetical protein
MNEDARLDRAELLAIINGRSCFPRSAAVSCMLEMNAPAIVFRAAGAKDIAISQLDRLVFDRTQYAFGQPMSLGPGSTAICRSH